MAHAWTGGFLIRIDRIRVDVLDLGRANSIFVRIETDEGITGLGETLLKRHDSTVRTSIEELGRTIVGRDPGEIEAIAEQLYRDSFWVGGAVAAAGRSAIDIALWDIKGQFLGRPIYELLGGPTRTRIPVYCHCPAGPTPEIFVERVVDACRRGYVGAKATLPLFYGADTAAPPTSYSGTRGVIDPRARETEYVPSSTFRRIAEYFEAARSAVGWDFELMLDCHGRLNPATALRLARELEPFGLLFLEEPVPPESAGVLAGVRKRSPVPVAAGERLTSVYEVVPFLEAGAVDYLQCDPVTCGGITGSKKIAALAEAFYVPFAPHNPNGPVATLACMHVLAAIPNAHVLETVGSPLDASRWPELVDGGPEIIEGSLSLTTGPGLGATLRDGAPDRFPAGSYTGTR